LSIFSLLFSKSSVNNLQSPGGTTNTKVIAIRNIEQRKQRLRKSSHRFRQSNRKFATH